MIHQTGPEPIASILTALSRELIDGTLPPLPHTTYPLDQAPGAWHLHQATEHHDLDWWLGFSSASAWLGFPGQGAYAAANGWLDGLTTHRRALGYPAHSIGWGAWAEHGLGTVFADRGYAMITPEEGIQATELLLRHNRPTTGYLPIHGPQWLQMFPTTFSSSFLGPLLSQSSHPTKEHDIGDRTAILSELRTDPDHRYDLLEHRLITYVAAILQRNPTTLDPQQPLREVGMDSLMALELRTRVEHDLGLRLPTKTLWSHNTAADLAGYILDRLDLDTPDRHEEPKP